MLLIDTHVLIWMDAGVSHPGASARSRIDEALSRRELFVSAISFWETAMLIKKKRLTIKIALATWRMDLISSGLQEMPVDGEIAIAAGRLTDFHGDPADRIIAATALIHGASLITADERILAWPQIETIDAKQ